MIVDQKLIDDCIKGKNAAIKTIYSNYANIMFGICFRYSGNRLDAEDIMQEGFVKIFRHIKSFQGNGSFEGWMKKIMINSALAFLKSKKKYCFIEDSEKLPEYGEDIFEKQEMQYDITSEQLITYIAQLPISYRTILNMYAIENYSHREIAQTIGISENVSRTKFCRAKKLLLDMIEKHKIEHKVKKAIEVYEPQL